MKNTKILIIAGIVLAAGVAAYFLFRKKDPLAGAAPKDGMGGTVAGDQATYDKMYNLLKANIDANALNHWLGDIARENLTSGNVHPDYLINGQITKSGALLSAWATAYQPYPEYTFRKDRNVLNGEMYNLFYSLKGTANRL